jgi:hypothetical protein
MASSRGELYVYALAAPGLPGTFRIHGRRLVAVRMGSIDAIVEPGRGRPPVAQDVLQQQHGIVTALLDRTDALLPARFGAWMSETALREAVASREQVMVEALAAVRGRRQMTVRVFGTVDPRVGKESSPTGTAYLERRRQLAHYVPAEAEVIRRAVGALAVAERVEPGARGLRVTVFHLVGLADTGDYVRRAQALDLAPHAVRVSGPWPAFAFTPELFQP